ncbi:hypothetical protein CDIF28670_03363 [Clostridioides difficile]|uniref:hypothetical protein n=2 Tax=Clostridioides difficile TaxID=1496 RepID=UPI000E4C62A9|nr:hypothetical protein [Clostridioides difficile]AXU76909.1 hypothetical protein CDIF28670_03363 [Clostridioides difficile]MDV9762087.1 hypothetical protein [Clostridioides difficile]
MNNMENKKNFLRKIVKLRNIFLSIFGVFLFITATTGIQTVDRYVPTWLYITLGVSATISLVLYVISFILKINIKDSKM